MGRLTKLIFIIGIALLIYGYLSRILDIYFFWDSKSFGWAVLFIGLMGYLFDLNKTRRIQGKKTFWVKMGIGIIIFGILLSVAIIFIIKKTDAYQTAIEHLKTDGDMKSKIGDVKGFGLLPTGSVASTTLNGDETGQAIFLITVNGTKKYKDVEITLDKTPETAWTVISVK